MKARVLTALVAIPLVLAIAGCTSPWALGVLLVLLAAICAWEFSDLFDFSPAAATPGILVVLLQAADAISDWRLFEGDQAPSTWAPAVLFPIGVIAGCFLRDSRRPEVLAGLASLWFGAALAGLMVIQASAFERVEAWSLPTPLLLVLLPVWAGDTAAMLAGKAFGKRLMAPRISPKKTWEGAIANLIASLLVGWAAGAWLGYPAWVGLASGTAVGVFGQLGDLYESALKRRAGRKDSGTLLPGHGGILDRIDALLASVIPVWLILQLAEWLGW